MTLFLSSCGTREDRISALKENGMTITHYLSDDDRKGSYEWFLAVNKKTKEVYAIRTTSSGNFEKVKPLGWYVDSLD